jgi:glycosyltransferase involved in cell wall biosynthesis
MNLLLCDQNPNPVLPVLSVIIPVYQADEVFFRLLRALSRQKTSLPFEVIVVDDGSCEENFILTEKILGGISNLDYRLLRTKENRGPAAARNYAISQSRGDLLLLIDSDCIVFREDHLERVYATHLRHPEALIGGAVDGTGNTYAALCDRFCSGTSIPGKTPGPIRPGRFAPLHVLTAHMILPSSVWKRIGPFNTSLRTGEDTAFCLRAHREGVPVRQEGTLTVKHRDRLTWGRVLKRHHETGRDRAASRQLSYGTAPWYLGGPKLLRWALVPLIALGVALRHFLAWVRYDKRIFLSLPGILVAMTSLAVGVALGERGAHLKTETERDLRREPSLSLIPEKN